MENPWSTHDRGPFRVSAVDAQSHEGDPAELRLILLTARPGMGCAAGILCALPAPVRPPNAALCDGHPVPEAEETQALQVTSVVVRRQEPIATTAPLSPASFSSGEGCRGGSVASGQPAGRGPGRKDLLLHGSLPRCR